MANLNDEQLEVAWQSLKKTFNHFPQASLLRGPVGLDKTFLALKLANSLFCQNNINPCGQCRDCHLFKVGNHPCFFYLHAEQDETIKIDKVRELNQQIFTKAIIGQVKVIVIDLVESLNVNATNALLKILEEPPEDTFFIGVSHDNARLLPTIRSRWIALPIPTILIQESQDDVLSSIASDLLALLASAADLANISQRWQALPANSLIDKLQTIFHQVLSYYSGVEEAKKWHLLADSVTITQANSWYTYLSELRRDLKRVKSLNHQYWVDALVAKIYSQGLI